MPRLDESNKENDPGLTITAPVPLSYAARSKAALKSILSSGSEGGKSPRAFRRLH